MDINESSGNDTEEDEPYLRDPRDGSDDETERDDMDEDDGDDGDDDDDSEDGSEESCNIHKNDPYKITR